MVKQKNLEINLQQRKKIQIAPQKMRCKKKLPYERDLSQFELLTHRNACIALYMGRERQK